MEFLLNMQESILTFMMFAKRILKKDITIKIARLVFVTRNPDIWYGEKWHKYYGILIDDEGFPEQGTIYIEDITKIPSKRTEQHKNTLRSSVFEILTANRARLGESTNLSAIEGMEKSVQIEKRGIEISCIKKSVVIKLATSERCWTSEYAINVLNWWTSGGWNASYTMLLIPIELIKVKETYDIMI